MEISIQPPKYGRNICTIGMYFGTLLRKGYNFDQQSTHIKTATDVNGKDICKFYLDMIVNNAYSIATFECLCSCSWTIVNTLFYILTSLYWQLPAAQYSSILILFCEQGFSNITHAISGFGTQYEYIQVILSLLRGTSDGGMPWYSQQYCINDI